MKIFLDANVLVSVLNKEYPVFTYSSRILSAASNKRFKAFTSPACLAIAYYFAEKKSGSKLAIQKINVLAAHLNITTMNEETVIKTCSNRSIHDFEDGLQYYSALDSRCEVIVTENTNDYYFSDVEVLTSRLFFENYMQLS